MASKNVTPDKDTGWGVIYRLNNLFNQVETLAPSGNYDGWNFKLDRVFNNLLYRDKLKIEKDKDDNIKNIEIDEEAMKIKRWFDSRISIKKKAMRIALKTQSPEKDKMNNKEYIKAKNELYDTIFKKEIWLRKYMQELGLYLKELEYNPAGAMWGK